MTTPWVTLLHGKEEFNGPFLACHPSGDLLLGCETREGTLDANANLSVALFITKGG